MMPRMTETARLMVMACPLSLFIMLCTDGKAIPITTMMSMVEDNPAESLLNLCSLYFKPPAIIDKPTSKRTFIRIEPTMEALTSSKSPRCSANMAMNSSTAFPKVALKRADAVLETRAAMIPVDEAISRVRGIMDRAAAMKTAV